MLRSRWLLPLALTASLLWLAGGAWGRTGHGGPLTGTWSGFISGQHGSGVKRQHIIIVVNARQTGGTWSLGRTCHGPLTLDSISGGYHHYLRKLARGSMCKGGDIDCLKRAAANVYDAVTSHRGGEYDSSGTLRRVRQH